MQKFQSILNSKSFFIIIITSFLLLLGKQSDHYFKWIHPHKVSEYNFLSIMSDGAGYYAYLPQWYIYKTNDFSFFKRINKKYKTISFVSGVKYDFNKNKGTDKYFIGTAICSTPLFLINHFLNKTFSSEADGYSRSYQLTVAINALLFWFIGIIAIIKLLIDWKIKRFWILTFIGIITFGTNLNFYTVYFPSFSHIYSFAIISCFIYFTHKWSRSNKRKHFILMFVMLGLVTIIRPTNALIIFVIPFFFSDTRVFFQRVKLLFLKNYLDYVFSIGTLSFFIFLQCYNVYSQTGDFKFNMYTNEQFDFIFNPQIYNVLFSYKKGYLIYSPVMFITFIGMIKLYLTHKFKFFYWLFVSILFLYITSSWWCWWYGGGLGMRPFVDILLLLSFPIIYIFKSEKNSLKLVIITISIPLIWIYQIYQIQYNKVIIHYEKMDEANFWRCFLKTDSRFAWSADFKEQKFPKQNYEVIKRYKINSTISKETQLNFKSLNYNNQIGIDIQYDIKINKQESNPYCYAYYFSKGRKIKKSTAFLGYRIPELNQFSKVNVKFYPNIHFNQIDSIQIVTGVKIRPSYIKNLNIKLLSFKSN